MKPSKRTLPICPRCGEPYSWIEERKIGNNVYYYAVHVKKVGSKRKVKKCYLGPEIYRYVTKTHSREGLALKGLVDPDRVIHYLDTIIAYISTIPLEPAIALRLAQKFEEIAQTLRKWCKTSKQNTR